MRGESVEPPEISAKEDEAVRLAHPDIESLRSWVVYRETGGGYVVDRVVPADEGRVELGAGQWAISAAGRHGAESEGYAFEL